MNNEGLDGWQWFLVFCAMSCCVFVGIGAVLLAIQSLMELNIKKFLIFLCFVPFWAAGHWLAKRLSGRPRVRH